MTWVAGPGGPTWLCGSHSSRRRQVEASHDAYSIAGGVALPGIQWSSAGRHFATGACQTTRSPPCHESHGSHKGHKSHKSHKSHKGHKGHKGHRGHRGRAIMPTRAWTRRGRAARGVPSGQSFSARSAGGGANGRPARGGACSCQDAGGSVRRRGQKLHCAVRRCVTLCSPVWPCVALCGPVLLCVALCGPVRSCVALCGPAWPSCCPGGKHSWLVFC